MVMTTYEVTALVLAFITLLVLVIYAWHTKTLAQAAVEQLPRPCVVVKLLADASLEAGMENTTCSVQEWNLSFVNVGAGPAVNVHYSVRDADKASDEAPGQQQLPPMAPGESFESLRPRNGLPESAVVTIEFESVAGSTYRTETTIKDRKFLTAWRFAT